MARTEPDLNAPLDQFEETALKAIYATVPLPNNRNIRILTLLPGNLNDEVECQLGTASLEDDPTFTALSYCWGDSALRHDISVNGHRVSVTESLETALRYMRDGENSTPVWADAICINQADRDEKSVQVAMMGDIYAQGKLPCSLS
jgi:hypothetical protein